MAKAHVDPDLNEMIASLKLSAAKPGGQEGPVELRLFRPYPVEGGEWECRFSIVGLLEGMPPTRDATSWQALKLATDFMHFHLETMIECGGRLTNPTTGADVDVADIFTSTGRRRR